MTLYEVRPFGEDYTHVLPSGKFFTEEHNLATLDPLVELVATGRLKRALGLARRHLTREGFDQQTAHSKMASSDSLPTEMESEEKSTETQAELETKPINTHVAWDDRKTAVNKLFRLIKAVMKLNRTEAQDEALLMEQNILQSTSTAAEYWELITKKSMSLKTASSNNLLTSGSLQL